MRQPEPTTGGHSSVPWGTNGGTNVAPPFLAGAMPGTSSSHAAGRQRRLTLLRHGQAARVFALDRIPQRSVPNAAPLVHPGGQFGVALVQASELGFSLGQILAGSPGSAPIRDGLSYEYSVSACADAPVAPEVLMATKTISIDLDAYARLTHVRRGRESFSQVIKRAIRPPLDVEAYLANLDRNPLGNEAVEAIEKHARTRHAPSMRDR